MVSSCFMFCSFSDPSDILYGLIQVRWVSQLVFTFINWDKYTSFSWRITSPPYLVWGHCRNEVYSNLGLLSFVFPSNVRVSFRSGNPVIKLLKYCRRFSLPTNYRALCPVCSFDHNGKSLGKEPALKPGKWPWEQSYTPLKRLQIKAFKYLWEFFFLPIISIENRSLILCTAWKLLHSVFS